MGLLSIFLDDLDPYPNYIKGFIKDEQKKINEEKMRLNTNFTKLKNAIIATLKLQEIRAERPWSSDSKYFVGFHWTLFAIVWGLTLYIMSDPFYCLDPMLFALDGGS